MVKNRQPDAAILAGILFPGALPQKNLSPLEACRLCMIEYRSIRQKLILLNLSRASLKLGSSEAPAAARRP